MEKMTNLENQGASSPAQESLLTKGEERYAKAGAFVSSMKEKTSNAFSRVAGFFSKTPKAVAVGILSTPEIAMAGVKKIDQGLDYLEDKGIAFENYVVGKAEQGYEFVKEKKDLTVEYVQDKADTLRAVAELSQQVIEEKFDDAKQKIEEIRSRVALQGEKLVEFGQQAILAAQMKKQEIVNSWRNKFNSLRLAIAEKKMEVRDARLEKARAKVEALRSLQEMYKQESVLA
jgi:hypothetical protein